MHLHMPTQGGTAMIFRSSLRLVFILVIVWCQLHFDLTMVLPRPSAGLSVPKKSQSQKIAALRNRKFCCRNRTNIARKPQKKSPKNRCDILGRGKKKTLLRSQNRSVLGTLSSWDWQSPHGNNPGTVNISAFPGRISSDGSQGVTESSGRCLAAPSKKQACLPL